MPKKKPTYCEDSARDPEDAWIFDSLVGFLRGPVWHVPVMSFIEQKSLSKWNFHENCSFLLIFLKNPMIRLKIGFLIHSLDSCGDPFDTYPWWVLLNKIHAVSENFTKIVHLFLKIYSFFTIFFTTRYACFSPILWC